MKCLIVLVALTTLAIAKPAARIVGGEDVDPPGKYPWQGSLQSFSDFHSCGTVVISNKYVLTAAHCVISQSPATRKVVLGMHDKDTRLEGNPTDYNIERIDNHPLYTSGPPTYWANDVAVLTIEGTIDLTDQYVSAIGMADENSPDFSDNEDCHITGWGRTRGGGPSPNILQEANIDVLSPAECRANRPGQIYDYHICVGKRFTADQGACQGDSGGPLSCRHNGNWVVAGITSWGNSFCATTQASVYARVGFSGIRSFIREITNM
ncbi:unnamed protein product [Dimorphilus gyrociliatus]|uniref:Peptidase S1 domain-containing protein n=1 Tax=Dimorphilus gyrociliatus TaxID=2664684 RepID=A0A7I8VKQ8_9ANNE|nr:unnamed protein product [Dimorphilus gyrociliatus]